MSRPGAYRWWRFLLWCLVTLAIAILVFVPHSLKFGMISEAGFPLRYASWEGGELASFSFLVLLVDAAFPLTLAAILFWLFLRERRSTSSNAGDAVESAGPSGD